jgi:hypothetical protein
MSVFSASRSSYPLGRATSRPRQERSIGSWARSRLAGRTNRRLVAVSERAAHRLGQHLGPTWQVVRLPDPDAASVADDHAGFLAIGPSGVFAISVVDQGRQRVMIAGDVIQIQGRRPPYVLRARKFARTVRSALTTAVGTRVPVVPVLTFVGSGAISAHGLPTGCLAVPLKELGAVLLAAGDKIAPETARKLADVAGHPLTWVQR